jgi:acyl-CoA synthetase (AMP-forming)/AMP-acid ligase II
VNRSDLCFLHSLGSTFAKGVMVTHGNLVANAQAFLGPGGLIGADDLAPAGFRVS